MNDLLTLFSTAAPAALIVTLWVMAQISRRFGEVTHRPPIYRGFYAALVLTIVPLVIRLLAIGLTKRETADLGGNTVETLLHDVPLAISVSLAVILAWRYWGWLIYAREGQSPVVPRHSNQ
jgi:hypothetical protein